MTANDFFEHFATLADAPGGIPKLRELILQLAVQGKLVSTESSDEPADIANEELGITSSRNDRQTEKPGSQHAWMTRIGKAAPIGHCLTYLSLDLPRRICVG